MARLETIGALLAHKFSGAVFRSGNAVGSDAAFARGVANVDSKRLELVVPYASHRRADRPQGARILALNEAQSQQEIVQLTLRASSQYQWLAVQNGPKSQAKFSYLLRDTLKVLGAPELGFTPATVGLFYVNDPNKGGTARTLRVCRENGVLALTQETWLE